MGVTYAAALPAGEHTVDFLTRLLTAERARRGTGAGTRAVPARKQAILVLRWLFDDTRMRQLATDNQISVSTGYEGIDVLAADSSSLRGAARPAGTTAATSLILASG
jgi:hypothetical protein